MAAIGHFLSEILISRDLPQLRVSVLLLTVEVLDAHRSSIA
jgi:hypothetical protein